MQQLCNTRKHVTNVAAKATDQHAYIAIIDSVSF